MKKVKFVGFILMMMITIMHCMTPVLADDPTGSIILHKYNVETLVNRTLPGDGTELPGNTDIGGGKRLDELEAMSNIPFVLTRMEVIPGKEGSTQLQDYTRMTGTEIYSTTGSDGIIVWDNLPFGYYLVEEEDNGLSDTIIQPFIVQIPMTNPTGNGFLHEVHVYPKNMTTGPEVHKELVPPDPDSGSNILRWRIWVDIPDDIADAFKFTITDELDPRLIFLADTMSVYYFIDHINGITFHDSLYTVDYNSATHTVLFTLEDAGFTELGNLVASTPSGDVELFLEFNTIINVTQISELGDLDNTAEFNYTNSHYLEHTPKEPADPPSTILSGIEISKTDSSGTPLAGAVFNIYPSEAKAKSKTYALQDPLSASDWEVTTDQDGYAEFLGLRPGTYWLVETQAPPDGYNLLQEPKEVIIPDTGSAPYMVVVNVENNKGFILPTTGGEGTMLFTIGGFVLIGLAIMILSISIFIGGKRRRRNKILRRRF